MPDTSGSLTDNANAGKVRKIIEDLCGLAGATVVIAEHPGDDRRHVQVTYTGQLPMPYAQWFTLVDSIDAALDPSGLIDWEDSELSEETDEPRTAAWAILPSAAV